MSRFRGRAGQAVLAGAMVLLLAGCSSMLSTENWKKLLYSGDKLQQVSILAASDVNSGYPVALDLLLVTDQKVFDALSALRATEWFAGKADFIRQHQKKLFVQSWELVPGQNFADVPMPFEATGTVGTLVFADYPGERSYRSVVQHQKSVLIRLGRDDFDVVAD